MRCWSSFLILEACSCQLGGVEPCEGPLQFHRVVPFLVFFMAHRKHDLHTLVPASSARAYGALDAVLRPLAGADQSPGPGSLKQSSACNIPGRWRILRVNTVCLTSWVRGCPGVRGPQTARLQAGYLPGNPTDVDSCDFKYCAQGCYDNWKRPHLHRYRYTKETKPSIKAQPPPAPGASVEANRALRAEDLHLRTTDQPSEAKPQGAYD